MEPWIALLVLLATLAALVAYVALSYFHVPANKIALVNWQFPFSPKIPPGHTIAAQWEQGWWAKHFGPGHHFFEVPLSRLFASIEYRDFVQIPANKFGLVEARDGKPLSQGQVVADRIIHKPGQEKTDLADGEYFLTHGGQRGYQLDLLPPGLWAINARKKGDKTTEGKPGFLWEIEEIDPEIILAKEVGIRISNIGERPDIATEV
ncbi:MAG: hypothetical protein Q8P35_01205, partial [Candidatus Yanofskybacteria bacterium]|nr:hypothetical protein [Candidatus Yanofskybacteria bacterium]